MFLILSAFLIIFNISAPKEIDKIPLNQEEKKLFEDFFEQNRSIVELDPKLDENMRNLFLYLLKSSVSLALVSSGQVFSGGLMFFNSVTNLNKQDEILKERAKQEQQIKQKEEDVKIFFLAVNEIKKYRQRILESIKEQNKLFQRNYLLALRKYNFSKEQAFNYAARLDKGESEEEAIRKNIS